MENNDISVCNFPSRCHIKDIDPHIIGITESWANIDITDAELVMHIDIDSQEPQCWCPKKFTHYFYVQS